MTAPTVSPSLPPRRRRARLVPLAAALAVLGAAGTLAGCTEQQNRVMTLVNDSRTQSGLAPLSWNGTLGTKAQRWAEQLAATCSLSHSTLTDGAPSNWKLLGENVGRGGSIEAIHTSYLDSPGHRANIMEPRFTQIGTGYATNTCPIPNTASTGPYVFTVQVFMKPQ